MKCHFERDEKNKESENECFHSVYGKTKLKYSFLDALGRLLQLKLEFNLSDLCNTRLHLKSMLVSKKKLQS